MSRKASSSIGHLRVLIRVLVLLGAPFILSACVPGCKGDEEPKQVKLVATAIPGGITLKPGGEERVRIEVRCDSEDCTGVAEYQPGWSAGSSSPHFVVEDLDENALVTEPVIKYVGPNPEPTSLSARPQLSVTFSPINTPLHGERPNAVAVGVTIEPDVDEPVIEESSADEPSLTRSMSGRHFGGSGVEKVSFIYDGPEEAQITITTMKDADFTIEGPSGTLTVQPGQRLEFEVKFSTAEDIDQNASIEVKVDDETQTSMKFTGGLF